MVAPIVAAYEAGILWLGTRNPAIERTGADTWMRSAFAAAGLKDQWLLPLLLVLVLTGWQVVRFHDWRFSPSILAGMILESLAWALALLGISRMIDVGFAYLEHSTVFLAAGPPVSHVSLETVIGCLGAGVYEETLFRLLLVPALFGALRTLQTPQIPASALAVTGSALLFALAHHAGTPGESFTWFAFIFRWMAGVVFAWLFVLRGFGIAVGTHTIYDILVGSLAWGA
jgi:hypothetical protein